MMPDTEIRCRFCNSDPCACSPSVRTSDHRKVAKCIERIKISHKDFARYRDMAIDIAEAWRDGFHTLRVVTIPGEVGVLCVEVLDTYPDCASVHVRLHRLQPRGPVIGEWEVLGIVRESYGSK